MVAISLYRGNLHRVPDVPRRWLMPNHTLSLKDFKSLLRKREKTLYRIRSTTTTIATTSNPNPNYCAERQHDHEFVGDNECSKQNATIEPPQPQSQTSDDVAVKSESQKVHDEPVHHHRTVGDAKDQSGSEGDNCVEEQRKGIGGSFSSPDTKTATPEIRCSVKTGGDGVVVGVLQASKKQPTSAEPDAETEKKKRDLEQNLKVLNERKHNLVQMLKQILNAEEEIKRRNSMQALASGVPHHVEATNDLGSNPRQQQQGAEANFCGDLEGESEDPRRSTSPSASPPLRKLAQTMVAHSNRPNVGGSGQTPTTSGMFASSPSRFAPSGHQGYPAISVSGTHYTASSPSPAGSGGTSLFRDARIRGDPC